MECLGCSRPLRSLEEIGFGLHQPSCEDAAGQKVLGFPGPATRLYRHKLARQRDLRVKHRTTLLREREKGAVA